MRDQTTNARAEHLPGQPILLATAPKRRQPGTHHLSPEGFEGIDVAGDGEVPEVPRHYPTQPLGLLVERSMTPPVKDVADRPRAVEALAFIRTLYAVEREIKDDRDKLGDKFTDADIVRMRQTRAGPILTTFSRWLEVQHRSATPKSLFGQAVEYSRNRWASLVRYLDDARFDIDNGAAERAIRPLATGRSNWLHVGGDGGSKTAAVLLSVCASATRNGLNPWSYLRDVLDQLAVRSAGDDVSDLPANAWAVRNGRTN